MMSRLTRLLPPWTSPVLAALILLGMIAVGYLGLVAPVLDQLDEADRLQVEYRQALEQGRAMGGRLTGLRAQLAGLKQDETAESGFLQGANESLAAAQLQNRIKAFVEASGGELRSTQVLPAHDEGKFRRIVVRGQMAASTVALQRIIYDIEAASPFLFLDNLDIRARSMPQDGTPDDIMLDVRFDLYGDVRGNT
jgi:general secretion pathway protein M